MKNKCLSVILLLFVLTGCRMQPGTKADKPVVSPIIWYLPEWEWEELPESRIELLRFHHTVECEDCRMLGEMVLYLLQNTFSQEAREGKIIYQSINSELFENKPLLQHYEVMEEDFVINFVNKGTESVNHDPKPLGLAKQADQLHLYLKDLLQKELKKLEDINAKP